jgi:hypothetical protein
MKPNKKKIMMSRRLSAQQLYAQAKVGARKIEVVDRAGSDRMLKQLFKRK